VIDVRVHDLDRGSSNNWRLILRQFRRSTSLKNDAWRSHLRLKTTRNIAIICRVFLARFRSRSKIERASFSHGSRERRKRAIRAPRSSIPRKVLFAPSKRLPPLLLLSPFDARPEGALNGNSVSYVSSEAPRMKRQFHLRPLARISLPLNRVYLNLP